MDEPAEDPAQPTQPSDGTQHVVAVLFSDKPTRADEALLALTHLQIEGVIEIADAVVVAKTEDGRTLIRQTVDVTPGRAAVSGAWLGTFVGLLLGGPLGGAVAGAASGALLAKLIDVGLDDKWVKQMAAWLDPGTSALLLLLNDAEIRDETLRELSRFQGKVISTTFPDDVRREIEQTLQS